MKTMDLINLKGTRHGILLSFEEEEDLENVLEEFKSKISENPGFFSKVAVSLDLGWRELTEEEFLTLQQFFKEHCLTLQGIISSSGITRQIAESYGLKVIIGRLGLAQHAGRKKHVKKEESPAANPESDTLLVKRTMRSGQKINFSGNIVILGDINPGSEVSAGGDIIVWGAIRGLVQAGSEGKESAIILANKINPSQLRIGNSLALINYSKNFDEKLPQIAHLNGTEIIISNYPQ